MVHPAWSGQLTWGEAPGLGVDQAYLQGLAQLTLAMAMGLDQLTNLSVPQFPHLQTDQGFSTGRATLPSSEHLEFLETFLVGGGRATGMAPKHPAKHRTALPQNKRKTQAPNTNPC